MSSQEYKAYQKLYYQKNKEARIEYFKTCYRKNKNKHLNRQKEYYQLNKDYFIAYNKEYYQSNKDYWINYKDKIKGYEIINYNMEISVIKNPILDFDDEILGESNYKVIFKNINRRIIQPEPIRYNEILEFDGELSSDEEQEQYHREEQEQDHIYESVNQLLRVRIYRDRFYTRL